MVISFVNPHETILYAAEELRDALRAVGGIEAELRSGGFADTGIRLGLLDELDRDASDVRDPVLDDVIDADIRSGEGFIAGSNPRSVLMGVYEYLKSMGCRWLCPGEAGAYLPRCDVGAHSFTFRKKADFPFRGECIEGAVSFENVRDTIRWLPKVGMNLFMMEQVVPWNYMSRWYRHSVSTVKEPEAVTFEDVGEMIPLEARIMAVADVYDALVSKRVYKEPMSYDKAAQIMVEGMGTQFDPNMHLVFLNCRDELERYYSQAK